jgi:hypothetical protein
VRAGRDPAVYLESVQVRQHHVEHDQVGPEPLGGSQRRPAVGCRLDLALVAQHRRQQLDDRLLVVDHQDAGGLVGCGCGGGHPPDSRSRSWEFAVRAM